MNDWETIIGLEVHVELNTKSKMFCNCSADYFGAKPNSHTCPTCLGLPGALPFINQEAIEKCIKIGLALNCTPNLNNYFERKNYFYPDLPKGYQITQMAQPLNVNGWMEVEDDQGQVSKIRINRAHQEEDTGKLTHTGSETLVDFNRSGVPLVEIVTEPDFRHPSQVRDYAKKLQQIFRYVGVSNADMEKGDMRLEANVSVRKKGQSDLPNYRVELKNINSFRFMVAAIDYEVSRQIKALESGEKLSQETRGWNEVKKETYLQRSKEEAHDYRYFPEPDLPVLEISSELVEKLKKELPELPSEKINRWTKDFGLSKTDGRILADTKEQAAFFEAAVEYGKDKEVTPKQIANYIINQKLDLIDSSSQQVVDDILAKQFRVLEDETKIEKMVSEVIKENPDLVESYKKGKLRVINALIGQVIRKSDGKANSVKVKEMLEKKLT